MSVNIRLNNSGNDVDKINKNALHYQIKAETKIPIRTIGFDSVSFNYNIQDMKVI